MKSSLATILGLALGSAVAYSPLPSFGQTPKELEAYEEAAKDAEKAMVRRAFDLEYAEVARIVVKDPTSKKISLKDYIGSSAGKVLILPQTYIEEHAPHDWFPLINEASKCSKVVVVFPSISQESLEKRIFPAEFNPHVKTLAMKIVQAGIEVKGAYAPHDETSAYKADRAEGGRIKAIQSQHPPKTIIVAGEDNNRYLPSIHDEDSLPIGAARAYRDEGLSTFILYPVDHQSDGTLSNIISERAESHRTHPADEWKPDFNRCMREVFGFVDGYTIYIPLHASGGTK